MGERHAAQIGTAILQGFAKGRARAIAAARERGALHASIVALLANQDREAGRARRGLAGRIARKMRGAITERQVKRILDRLMSMSDSTCQSAHQQKEVRHE